MPVMDDDPQNLEQWLYRVRRYEKNIFVREKGPDGKFDSVSLDSLSPERWAFWVAAWLDKSVIPVRVREPEEIGDREAP